MRLTTSPEIPHPISRIVRFLASQELDLRAPRTMVVPHDGPRSSQHTTSPDRAPEHLQVVHDLDNQRETGGPVVAASGQQPGAYRVTAAHEPIVVVLDLVNPVRARLSAGDGRHGSMMPTRVRKRESMGDQMPRQRASVEVRIGAGKPREGWRPTRRVGRQIRADEPVSVPPPILPSDEKAPRTACACDWAREPVFV